MTKSASGYPAVSLVIGLCLLAGSADAERLASPDGRDLFGSVVEVNSVASAPVTLLDEAIDPDATQAEDESSNVAPVPLPSGALAGMGLIGAMVLYRRRRRAVFHD